MAKKHKYNFIAIKTKYDFPMNTDFQQKTEQLRSGGWSKDDIGYLFAIETLKQYPIVKSKDGEVIFLKLPTEKKARSLQMRYDMQFNNMTVKEIAEKYNVPRSVVYRVCENIRNKKRSWQGLSEKTNEIMRLLVQGNLTQTEIGRQTGVSRQRVSEIYIKYIKER